MGQSEGVVQEVGKFGRSMFFWSPARTRRKHEFIWRDLRRSGLSERRRAGIDVDMSGSVMVTSTGSRKVQVLSRHSNGR